MRMIEAEIHDILLEIASDAHDYEEQAQIVATAADIFRQSEAQFNQKMMKKASSATPEKLKEALIVDALFQAMGHLSDWHKTASIEDYEADAEYNMTYVDGRGLDPEQITRKAAKTVVGQGQFGSMSILNDEELDEFFGAPKGFEADEYFLDDGEERHCPELYRTPGIGKHRSDSTGR